MTGYEVFPDNSVGEILATRFFSIMDFFTNEIFFGGSLSFPDVQLPVADFILASVPGGFEGARNNNTPTVHECEIHWVIKQLKATVDAGQLTEETLDTIQFETNLTTPWDPEDDANWIGSYNKVLKDPITGESTTFGMDNTTSFKVWEVWQEIAPSAFTLPIYDTQPPPGTAIPQSGPVFKYWWLGRPPRVAQMYNLNSPWAPPNNLSQHMTNVVTVMNQVLRRNSLSVGERNDAAVGKAYIYQVLVEIRWKWLSLPLILLMFSLMFLIATVVRSSRDQENIGIFKTSALAILFNGLGDDVQERVGYGGVNRMGYARERAKDMKVHLDDD